MWPPALFTENRLKHTQTMSLGIHLGREEDGRWIAEVPALPGVMAYGQDRDEAVRAVQSLALRVIADRLEQGEPVSQEVLDAFYIAA